VQNIRKFRNTGVSGSSSSAVHQRSSGKSGTSEVQNTGVSSSSGSSGTNGLKCRYIRKFRNTGVSGSSSFIRKYRS
jgi:hypothetical protein